MVLPYDPKRVDEAGRHFDETVRRIQAREFAVTTPPEAAICKECDLRILCQAEGIIAPEGLTSDMAKIDITRTELVWPGKYNEDGTLKEVPRVSLPFQVIETVNESRATREAKKGGVQGGLFDVYEGKEGDTFEAGWRNKLIWGDNLLVMGSLLEKFAGKIDLIYIDPPFATGADFSFTTQSANRRRDLRRSSQLIEEKAYRDTWGRGIDSLSYEMMSRPLT